MTRAKVKSLKTMPKDKVAEYILKFKISEKGKAPGDRTWTMFFDGITCGMDVKKVTLDMLHKRVKSLCDGST